MISREALWMYFYKPEHDRRVSAVSSGHGRTVSPENEMQHLWPPVPPMVRLLETGSGQGSLDAITPEQGGP